MPLARADCSNPVGSGGDILYNLDHTVMQYCNDTDWISMGVNSSDNLGNHTATQALDMSGNRISNVTNPAVAQDAATKLYVDSLTGANETDPQVGTLTSTKWCTTNGTSINCTTNAPILIELDPQVGTLTNTKWCTTNGTTINCTTNAPILTELDPQVGTLTNARWCTTNGTTINCTSNAPGGVGASVIEDLTNVDTAGKGVNDVLSWNGTNWVDKSISIVETDPQVTTVTNNKWCRGNGSAVVCDQNVPIIVEADPQVGTLTNTKWCTTDGSVINCTSDAPSGGSGGGYENLDIIASSQSWVVPAGVGKIFAVVFGGGGGGGHSYTTQNSLPGGKGGMAMGEITTTPGASITITVGAGGDCATSYTTYGGNGGTTTIETISATGGEGSKYNNYQGASGIGSGDIVNKGVDVNFIFGMVASSFSMLMKMADFNGQATIRANAASSTAAIAYSSTGDFVPGARGYGELAGENGTGGVGGAVFIFY